MDPLAPKPVSSVATRGVRLEKIVEGEIQSQIDAAIPATATQDHDILSGAHGAYFLTATGGLNVTLAPGKARLDNVVYTHGPSAFALTASATNYVMVNAAGALLVQTVPPASGLIPLWMVTTDATSVQTVTDQRAVIQNGAGGVSGGGGTLDTAYDFGGVGAGRTINATDGAVLIQNAEADTEPMLDLRRALADVTKSAQEIGITAEANPRFRQLTNGAMYWGAGGVTAADAILERSAAGTLRLTNTVMIINTPASTAITSLKAIDIPIATTFPGTNANVYTAISGTPRMQIGVATTTHFVTGLDFSPAAVISVNTTAVNWAQLNGASITLVGIANGNGRAMTIDVGEVYGSRSSLTIGGTGTIAFTEYNHFHGYAVSTTAAKTITTLYGFRLEAQSFTGVTTYYPIYIAGNASTTQGSVHRPSFQMFSTATAFGGGDGVLGIANATTAPTTNPGGGLVLWATGGDLKLRTSGGLVAQFGAVNTIPAAMTVAGQTDITGVLTVSSSTQLGSVTQAFGGGTGVIGIANAAGNPSTTPTGGCVVWSQSTFLQVRDAMANNAPIHCTPSIVVATTTLASSTTETELKKFTVPANACMAGTVFRITARGVFGTTGTPTLQMRVRWGGVAGTLLGDSTAITTPSGVTNRGWEVQFLVVIANIGASGTSENQGWFKWATAAATAAQADMENTATVTIDTTASKDLSLTAQWGTNSASNTITIRQFLVERL